MLLTICIYFGSLVTADPNRFIDNIFSDFFRIMTNLNDFQFCYAMESLGSNLSYAFRNDHFRQFLAAKECFFINFFQCIRKIQLF